MAGKSNTKCGRDIVVIGAGEVFQRCYLMGNAQLPPSRRLLFTHIVDILPEERLRSILSPRIVEHEFKIWQLLPEFKESLRNLLREPELKSLPILVATPTQYHVSYAEVILQEGHFAAIEKPIAASFQELQKFEGLLKKHGTDRLFLFAYYLLEKGLPLLVLAKRGYVDPLVTDLVTFESSFPNWGEAREALGQVRKIYGVILEGIGPAGGVNQRLWTLDPINGGNTIETFYHLMCLVNVVLGPECLVSIRDVRLARHAETTPVLVGRGIDPDTAAETLTRASLQSAFGAEIELIAAKYVPPRLHQRWVNIECEQGNIRMDLEAQRLEVRAKHHFLRSTLRCPQRYATQFMLLTEKLDRPNLPIEEVILLQALQLTLEIRQVGQPKGITLYRDEDIEPVYLSGELAHNLI